MRRLLLALALLLLVAAPSVSAGAADDRPGWTPVDCGCFHALSVEAVDRDLVFLGTDSGISRSTDGGFTWHQLSTPVHDEVRRVSFADADNGVASGHFEGVLVTHDGGSTWKQFRPWPGRTTDVSAVSGTYFGLTPDALYASTDGVVWKKVHGYLPGSPDPRMHWSTPRDGIVVRAPRAFTTTDGGVTFTEAPVAAIGLYDALSTGAGSGWAVGQYAKYGEEPSVVRVTGATAAPADLPGRGVAGEQEFGLSRSGSTLYAVGAEGVIARSPDDGASWGYEKTPPSYERTTFYDVDSIDADHAWIAVYVGRVLIRNAPRVHDVTTSPHRGLGLGLLGVTAITVVGAGAAFGTGRKPVAGGLAAVAVLSAGGGYVAVTNHGSCPASGCGVVAAPAEPSPTLSEAPSPTASPTLSPTASPTPSPTPSATPSATPTATATATPSRTASPTPSPTPRRTPSPTPSPTPAGAFTATLTTKPTCDPNGGAHPGQITLRNTTSAAVAWSATARERLQNQQPWATLSATSGTVQKGGQAVLSVTPDNSLCTPGDSPTTEHVDVKHGSATIAVAVTVIPQT